MAKRKRLTPPNPAYLDGSAPLRTKSMFAGPAPIADVAREASATAALDEMSQTLAAARAEGRFVLSVPLDHIDLNHLVRDRVVLGDPDMQSLMASLRDRGQQTPIEVVAIGADRYGLISGWRRCQALRRLYEDTGEDRFGSALVLLRQPDQASDAYLAMVEENEIRVGLSFYERARIVVKAVEQGVFASEKEALQGLFRSASRSKRSKVGSFLRIVHALDGVLKFPEVLSERAGLALAQALDDVDGLADELVQTLRATPSDAPDIEQALLEQTIAAARKKQSLNKPSVSDGYTPTPTDTPRGRQLAPNLWMRNLSNGNIVLSGTALTPQMRTDLRLWLRANTGS